MASDPAASTRRMQSTPVYRDIGQPVPIAQFLNKAMRIRINCEAYYHGLGSSLHTEATVDAMIESTVNANTFVLAHHEADFDMSLRIEENVLVLDVTGTGNHRAGGLFGEDHDPITLIIPPEVTQFRVTQLHNNVVSCVDVADPCAKLLPGLLYVGGSW